MILVKTNFSKSLRVLSQKLSKNKLFEQSLNFFKFKERKIDKVATGKKQEDF